MGETTTSSPTVLVVEDDETISELIRQVLTGDLDLRVEVARSGQEALDSAFLTDRDITLVILDLRLPEMSGEEVVRQLRAHGLRPPILLVSAAAPQELADAARRLRAYASLPKPFDLTELIDKVKLGLAEPERRAEPPRRIPVHRAGDRVADSLRSEGEVLRQKARRLREDSARAIRAVEDGSSQKRPLRPDSG